MLIWITVERILFSGDACNPNTLISLPGSTSVEEYQESLQHLLSYEEAYDAMYGGHSKDALPNTIVRDGIVVCGRILGGTDDAIETPSLGGGTAFLALERGADFLPKAGGRCNIVYQKAGIHRVKKGYIMDGPVI